VPQWTNLFVSAVRFNHHIKNAGDMAQHLVGGPQHEVINTWIQPFNHLHLFKDDTIADNHEIQEHQHELNEGQDVVNSAFVSASLTDETLISDILADDEHANGPIDTDVCTEDTHADII
jgi:hypothetical protein